MNPSERLYLSPPHLGEWERKYVAEAFNTNWIAPLGPNVDGFEREMALRVGVAAGAALVSGTSAIHLALKALNVKPGDHILCSSLTFSGSCNPILYEQAIPVFIDSDYATWNMSPKALALGIKELKRRGIKPKAAIIVDLYGQSADYCPLLFLCAQEGIPVIEDAAEALGASFLGKPCGSFGAYGILSFNGNKIITTSGGGMLLSNNVEALQKARFWATQSRDPARYYQHSELGYNYRMSNVLAGIGRGQLRVLSDRIARRKEVNTRYRQAFADIPEIEFMPVADYGKPNYWLTVITLNHNSAISPNQMMDALEAANIESRPVWKPMHLQPFFSKYPFFPHFTHAQQEILAEYQIRHASSWGGAPRSVSEDLFQRGVCLPSGSSMTSADQDRVIEVVRGLFHQEHISDSISELEPYSENDLAERSPLATSLMESAG